MSRPARLAAVTALGALVAAAPSTAPASTPAAASPPGATAALAAKSFSVLRRSPRPSDDVLRAVGATERKLPRGARARRVASGKGFSAFLVAGARVTGGVHAINAVQVVLVEGGKASAAEASVASAARDGVGVSWRLANGSYRTVAVVPNGASEARVTSAGKMMALRIRSNAVVAVTDGTGELGFSAANGSRRVVAVGGETPQTQPLPATATLLEGSRVTLDLGGGAVRDVPLSGTVTATLPGGYVLASTNRFVFTGADLHVAATDLLTDECTSPAVARLNPATGVTLDPKASTGSLSPSGAFTVNAAVGLRTILDVRGEQPCGAAAAPSGYADTAGLTFALSGQLGKGASLARFTLSSAPTPVTVNGCLAAGDPAKPCPQAAVAVSATATLTLVVRVQIGSAPVR